NTHREMQKLAKALHSAVRALSVSAYNRGGMWHVSALYRPCIGHRTGYSSQGMREMPGFSGLASADFEGGFARSYNKRCRPRLFLRAISNHDRLIDWASTSVAPPQHLDEEGCESDRVVADIMKIGAARLALDPADVWRPSAALRSRRSSRGRLLQ